MSIEQHMVSVDASEESLSSYSLSLALWQVEVGCNAATS